MGQELTARMHYRALVKKRLLPFTHDGTVQRGDTIIHNGMELGSVNAVEGTYGVGIFNLERSLPLVGTLIGEHALTLTRPAYL